MSLYLVTLPIAAFAELQVEAETEDKAIEWAESMVQLCDINWFESLRCVMLGDRCLFPRPWEATAEPLEEESAA